LIFKTNTRDGLELGPFYVVAVLFEIWVFTNSFRGAKVELSTDEIKVQTIFRKFKISKSDIEKVEIGPKYRGAVKMSMPCITLKSGGQAWLTDFSVPVGQEFRNFIRVGHERWTLPLMKDAMVRWVNPKYLSGPDDS
jgi:hypothetical protein